LHLTRNYLLPDYATYAFTAAASLFPTNADVADLARAQSGIVGYVHPFDWAPDPLSDPTLTHGEPADVALELPVDVALGKVDYMEVVGFSDHRSTAEIWYRLLNCGFRLPTGSGTDAMANYASLRGPVGLNRVYAAVSPGPINSDAWLTSLKQGRTFATNGPLLRFTMNDRMPGDELSFPASESKAKFKVWMRSIVPVDHLQIICNGKVASDVALSGDRMSADGEGTVPISRSGWCVLRASSDHAEYPVLDEYIYATTSPIYLKVAGAPRQPGQDAAFFIAWIDRLTAYANASKDWNTDTEKTAVMNTLSRARAVYEAMEK
jgi:hypothetical protein